MTRTGAIEAVTEDAHRRELRATLPARGGDRREDEGRDEPGEEAAVNDVRAPLPDEREAQRRPRSPA